VISLGVDEDKLRRSLEQAQKRLGETTQQAVGRLAVQLARENAVSSQAYGGAKQDGPVRKPAKHQPRQAQKLAIMADMRNVVIPIENPKKTAKTVKGYSLDENLKSNGRVISMPISRYLSTPGAVVDWVEVRRTRRRGRTPKGTHISELACCSKSTFTKALTIKTKKSGMTKGAWLGAGMKAAKLYKGVEGVGKSFLSYSQKHAKHGSARKSGNAFNPTIALTNKLGYSLNSNVLSANEVQKNSYFSAKKVLNSYKREARAALNK
jgi:hypothetical protein